MLQEQWRIDSFPAPDAQSPWLSEFYVDGGTVVIASRSRVDGYDVATGRRVWHYREPGRWVATGVTAGVVVLASEPEGQAVNVAGDETARLVGLDAATGEPLWERHNPWHVGGDPPLLTMGEGVLPVLPADPFNRNRLAGIDVHTGQPVWTVDLDVCDDAYIDPPDEGDGSLVLVQDYCGTDVRMWAFDPATGRQLWTHMWPGPTSVSPTHTTVHQRTTTITTVSQPQVIGPDGSTSTIGVEPWQDPVGFYLPVTEEGEDYGSTLVDTRTGAVLARGWPTPLAGQVAVDGAGHLYVLDEFGGPVPGVARGNPAGGPPTWMPLPGSELVDGGAIWTAMAGGQLLVARQDVDPPRVRLFAYAATPAGGGPVQLGGVPTSDWPDPCQLPVDGATGTTTPLTSPPITLPGGAEYPRRACQIDIENPAFPRYPDEIEVEILWVAASPEQAEHWLGGSHGPNGVDEIIDREYVLRARIGRVLLEIRNYLGADIDPEALVATWVEPLS